MRSLVATLLICLTTACGYKGPLYLAPAKGTPPAPNATATPAPTPTTTPSPQATTSEAAKQ